MAMSTKERSGFEVKKFTAHFKILSWKPWNSTAMDIQTGKSRLRNFFAMQYYSFDDMSDFINKVTMEADFAGCRNR